MTKEQREQFTEEIMFEYGVEFPWREFWEVYGR